jgi:hypothetical protein
MVSLGAVRRAEELRKERESVHGARWNAVVYNNRFPAPDRSAGLEFTAVLSSSGAVAADEELQEAIEAFRQRELERIDAKLRRLGIDPEVEDEWSD